MERTKLLLILHSLTSILNIDNGALLLKASDLIISALEKEGITKSVYLLWC